MGPIQRIAKPGIVSKMPKIHKSEKRFACDIFPEHPSKFVEQLDSYPNFKNVFGNKCVKAYKLYMETGNKKIYYFKREVDDRYEGHFTYCGGLSRFLENFTPNRIDWIKVKKGYQRDTSDKNRSNIDTRVSFRMKNQYLVKKFFTFGQRTVKPETAHVIQTLNVPLLFFVKTMENLKDTERLFPCKNILSYGKRILEPNTCFRIPPNTTYFIVSTQKNFFSVDIVSKDYVIPFEYVDPVANPRSTFRDYLDLPVKTPYANPDSVDGSSDDDIEETLRQPSIEETLRQPSIEETLQQPSIDLQQPSIDHQQNVSFEPQQIVFFDQTLQQNVVFDQQQQNVVFDHQQQNVVFDPQQPSFETLPNKTQNESFAAFNGYNRNDMANMLEDFYTPVQQPVQPPANNQQLLYYVLPVLNEKSPIFEKNIVVATQEFVAAYQNLKAEYPNPKLEMQYNDSFHPEPMDLSVKNDILDIAMMDALLQPPTPEKESEMDEIMSDLFNSIPENNECTLLEL